MRVTCNLWIGAFGNGHRHLFQGCRILIPAQWCIIAQRIDDRRCQIGKIGKDAVNRRAVVAFEQCTGNIVLRDPVPERRHMRHARRRIVGKCHGPFDCQVIVALEILKRIMEGHQAASPQGMKDLGDLTVQRRNPVARGACVLSITGAVVGIGLRQLFGDFQQPDAGICGAQPKMRVMDAIVVVTMGIGVLGVMGVFFVFFAVVAVVIVRVVIMRVVIVPGLFMRVVVALVTVISLVVIIVMMVVVCIPVVIAVVIPVVIPMIMAVIVTAKIGRRPARQQHCPLDI